MKRIFLTLVVICSGARAEGVGVRSKFALFFGRREISLADQVEHRVPSHLVDDADWHGGRRVREILEHSIERERLGLRADLGSAPAIFRAEFNEIANDVKMAYHRGWILRGSLAARGQAFAITQLRQTQTPHAVDRITARVLLGGQQIAELAVAPPDLIWRSSRSDLLVEASPAFRERLSLWLGPNVELVLILRVLTGEAMELRFSERALDRFLHPRGVEGFLRACRRFLDQV